MNAHGNILKKLRIQYVTESEGSDLFDAIQKNYSLDSSHKNSAFLKQNVYKSMNNIDIENTVLQCELLNLIGKALDNVRVIVVDDENCRIMGGGCEKKKCKHYIILQKGDNLYFTLSINDKDVLKIERLLKNGIYYPKSRSIQKFCAFLASITVVMTIAFYTNAIEYLQTFALFNKSNLEVTY